MKTIELTLGAVSINRAIKELERYAQSLEHNCDLFRQRIADEIVNNMDFARCLINVWQFVDAGEDQPATAVPITRSAEVTVTVQENGNVTTIIASGPDIIWVEFGTGVYHNGVVGASPHPKGEELGFVIGGYGKGRGKQRTWAYIDPDIGRTFTHGIPAYKTMYNAYIQVRSRIMEIAREVFTHD